MRKDEKKTEAKKNGADVSSVPARKTNLTKASLSGRENAPATGNASGRENAPTTGSASGRENAPATGNASGRENAPTTGSASGGENAPITGSASGRENASTTGNVSEQVTPPAERNPPGETSVTPQGNMSVFLYILLLFSAALLLMCLSSLIHQRNNTEALGKLQSSVSVMREVQNLQDKIISLQDAQRELEERLKHAQNDWSDAVARAETERKRADALQRLYVIEAQYQAGNYEACQSSIDGFEASGLTGNLPSESPLNDTLAPSERYQQIQEATLARIAEASQPPDAPEISE